MSEETAPDIPPFKEHDVHDAKMARTKQPGTPRCWKCDHRSSYPGHHSEGCPNTDMPSLQHALQGARSMEKWARERAAHWLSQVRQMYATQANLKNEIKTLRKRCKQLETRLKEKF